MEHPSLPRTTSVDKMGMTMWNITYLIKRQQGQAKPVQILHQKFKCSKAGQRTDPYNCKLYFCRNFIYQVPCCLIYCASQKNKQRNCPNHQTICSESVISDHKSIPCYESTIPDHSFIASNFKLNLDSFYNNFSLQSAEYYN